MIDPHIFQTKVFLAKVFGRLFVNEHGALVAVSAHAVLTKHVRFEIDKTASA